MQIEQTVHVSVRVFQRNKSTEILPAVDAKLGFIVRLSSGHALQKKGQIHILQYV
jgi:hypothetical protein